MNETGVQPIRLLRLGAYLLILGSCGAIAGREVVYAVACNETTGTVTAFGKTGGFAQRSTTYWADYEYFDTDGARHVGRAHSVSLLPNGVIPATTNRGDEVDVQYFRHAPASSRLRTSPLGGLCFGAVALLAAVVFVAELLVRRRRRRRRHGVFSPVE